VTFEAKPPAGASPVLRLADAENEVRFPLHGPTSISVLVEVQRGVSLLLVKTDPAATSLDDAIDVTTPSAEKVKGAATLHADLISPDLGF
jgi:hypothetical protein